MTGGAGHMQSIHLGDHAGQKQARRGRRKVTRCALQMNRGLIVSGVFLLVGIFFLACVLQRPLGSPSQARFLASSGSTAGNVGADSFAGAPSVVTAQPTLDQVDNSVFSRPPHSAGEANNIVLSMLLCCYLFSIALMLAALVLDSSERKRRRERAMVPEESLPCAIAEQYSMDELYLGLRCSQDFAYRSKRMTLGSFFIHYLRALPGALVRQHLWLSFVVRALPTFSRTKRGLLIVFQVHVCMLAAGIYINVVEHDLPPPSYAITSCSDSSSCFPTFPLALIFAVISYPVFRFAVYEQLRLTCFSSQTHAPAPETFPLDVRKFAYIEPKSATESFFCLRNRHERMQSMSAQARTLVHRLMRALWDSIHPSISSFRFYSPTTSCWILSGIAGFILLTLIYISVFTLYLRAAAAQQWVALTLFAFVLMNVFCDPMWIFFREVLWCAFVADLSQNWCFTAHALAHNVQYRDVSRQVENTFFRTMRTVGASRIQNWWRRRSEWDFAKQEETAAIVKIQAKRKQMLIQRQYEKNRRWCLKLELLECSELLEVELGVQMSPFVRFQCDTGNPNKYQSAVAWNENQFPKFNDTFWFDIKDSNAMDVTVWSKDLSKDEFVGRANFDFESLKANEKNSVHYLKLPLYDVQIGEKTGVKDKGNVEHRGYVSLRLVFLDPMKDICGNKGDLTWMMPKHRMALAMGKLGGDVKMGKMLGRINAVRTVAAAVGPMPSLPPPKPPVRPGDARLPGRADLSARPNDRVSLTPEERRRGIQAPAVQVDLPNAMPHPPESLR